MGVKNQKQPTYDENFKKSIVNLHQNGKSQSELHREYGVSSAAISRWARKYSEVKIDEEGTVMRANQVKELQKRLAAIEEENEILKKASVVHVLPLTCGSFNSVIMSDNLSAVFTSI